MNTLVRKESQRVGPVGIGFELPKADLAELARTTRDLEGAFRLVHDAYVRRGFMDPNAPEMRVCVYDALPMTKTIIVKKHRRVVGTLTIVPDNPLGLPLDEDFDTSAYRGTGKRVAEIMGLAVDAKHGGSGQVLFALFRKLLCLCIQDLDVEILQIAVAAADSGLYRFAMCFKDVEEKVIEDPVVKGASVRALYLDVRAAVEGYPRRHERSSRVRHLHKFFYESLARHGRSGMNRPEMRSVGEFRMSPNQLNYFFNERTDTFAKLSEKQLRLLRACYPEDRYARVLSTPGLTRGPRVSFGIERRT